MHYKGGTQRPSHLLATGDMLEDRANALGQHFEGVSSSAHYTAQLLRHKYLMEQQPLRKMNSEKMGYNCPFTIHEFSAALSTCGKTAPGADSITYGMIKHAYADTQAVIHLLSYGACRSSQDARCRAQV